MTDLTRAGKYEILERIGAGGFGVVYRGHDPMIKRTVAIKTCTSQDEAVRRRFLREAEIAGNLLHPNVTLIYDFGFEGEVPYLVQEFLGGCDLQRIIDERRPIPMATRLDWLRQAAEGLHFAHQRGVLHRDIKPGNLRILDDGKVKLLDFGIAKSDGHGTRLTRTGITLGTPAYVSPEQLRGEDPSPASDVYSFGVVAFEVMTYERMFEAPSISALFTRILEANRRRLQDVWRSAPPIPVPPLEAFIERCVALDLDRRFRSFDEVLPALEKLREELEEGARDGELKTVAITASQLRETLATIEPTGEPPPAAAGSSVDRVLEGVDPMPWSPPAPGGAAAAPPGSSAPESSAPESSAPESSAPGSPSTPPTSARQPVSSPRAPSSRRSESREASPPAPVSPGPPVPSTARSTAGGLPPSVARDEPAGGRSGQARTSSPASRSTPSRPVVRVTRSSPEPSTTAIVVAVLAIVVAVILVVLVLTRS